MTTNVQGMSLPKQIRLRTLEILLDNYGYVNRTTLCDIHGLGEAAVSKDIDDYKKLNPKAFYYKRSTRRIEKLSKFERYFS